MAANVILGLACKACIVSWRAFLILGSRLEVFNQPLHLQQPGLGTVNLYTVREMSPSAQSAGIVYFRRMTSQYAVLVVTSPLVLCFRVTSKPGDMPDSRQ